MNLYHGTYTDNFVKIVESYGCIKTNNNCQCIKDSETELLDKLIAQYTGRDFRSGCIYLTDDNDCTQAFDYAFTIDINELDTDELYVAENSYLDEILSLYYEKDTVKILSKIKEYIASYVPYTDYVKKEYPYKSPEYLYYEDIEVEVTDEDIEETYTIKNHIT